MLIDFAYDLAKEAHRPQKRTTGERYFEHPRAGCLIMMDELGLYDRDLLISFLLHDVGEDTALLGANTSYDVFVADAQFRLELMFGKTVFETVIRLTKPFVDNVNFFSKDEVYAYYIKRLKEDPNAIFGKIIDRLHNLRSLSLDSKNKIKKQIEETELFLMPVFKLLLGESIKANYLQSQALVLLKKMDFEISRLKASL
jgi:GTP pyrophosphokinase